MSTVPRALRQLCIPITVLVAIATTACSVLGQPSAPPAASQPSPAPATAAPAAQVAGVQAQGFSDLTFGVRQVASREKPAVVQITNQQVTLDRFTGSAVQVPAGVGSGIIYDQQGHILTNNHVIAGADGLEVSLPDGRAFPAKLVGADPPTDLAVLQIQGDNLPTAPLGDSGQLAVGDWVVAIGNALGLPGGPTVTVGVVSALGRTVQEPADQPSSPGLGPAAQRAPAAGAFLFDAIQTDAAINPGNSGGPLININGEVVGINTLVAAQAEPGVPAQGIGFAIAIASAKPIADQLVANGRVAHAYLGIGFAPLSPAIAAQLGVPSDAKGVAVAQVAPGSPAASAGVQPRDVITAIDGQPLTDESSLPKALAAHKPGDRVQVTINRRGQTQDVQVTLGEAPA